MSVREAQEKIDSQEFAHWIAFNQLEPFGEERQDLRFAMVCCLIANSQSRKTFKLEDFMLKFDHDRKPMDSEEAQSILKSILNGNNSKSGS